MLRTVRFRSEETIMASLVIAPSGATGKRVPMRRSTIANGVEKHPPSGRPTPVRKVITRRTKRVVGDFPSVKNGRQVLWESPLELDLCRLLEVSPDVVAFHAQPERMTLFID